MLCVPLLRLVSQENIEGPWARSSDLSSLSSAWRPYRRPFLHSHGPHYPPILRLPLGPLQRSPWKQAWLGVEASLWAIAATEGSQLYPLPTGLTHISWLCDLRLLWPTKQRPSNHHHGSALTFLRHPSCSQGPRLSCPHTVP